MTQELSPACREFKEFTLMDSGEAIRTAIGDFVARYPRDVLEDVYHNTEMSVDKLCHDKLSAENYTEISRLSYALGVLSRHLYPLPGNPVQPNRRARTESM